MTESKERIMIDIETLGTEPGCVILSIGAVRFNRDGIGETFHAQISKRSCLENGLTIDDETEEWWEQQEQDMPDGDQPLRLALEDLSEFCSDGDEFWANSPSFDLRILDAAYDAVEPASPWEYHQERDVRTFRNLPGFIEFEQNGQTHDALDDARHQAREVVLNLDRLFCDVWSTKEVES